MERSALWSQEGLEIPPDALQHGFTLSKVSLQIRSDSVLG